MYKRQTYQMTFLNVSGNWLCSNLVIANQSQPETETETETEMETDYAKLNRPRKAILLTENRKSRFSFFASPHFMRIVCEEPCLAEQAALLRRDAQAQDQTNIQSHKKKRTRRFFKG